MSLSSIADVFPSSMRSHLTKRLALSIDKQPSPINQGKSIITNIGDLPYDPLEVDTLAENILNNLIETNFDANKDPSENRRIINDKSNLIAKLLISSSPSRIRDVMDKKVKLNDLAEESLQYKLENRIIFEHITEQHNNVAVEWKSGIEDKESLTNYAVAAYAMGQKPWVKAGNEWIENLVIDYFCNGLAKKSYIKTMRKLNQFNTNAININNSTDKLKELKEKLPEDIMNVNENKRKIRLVDVGSCYNPFINCEKLDVLALDLHPNTLQSQGSVYKCDFLTLEVGENGSEPLIRINQPECIITDTMQSHKRKRSDSYYNDVLKSDVDMKDDLGDNNNSSVEKYDDEFHNSNGKELNDSLNFIEEPKELLRLPASSTDVVTMSLVISYLPTPEQRYEMVMKARQLLINNDPKQSDQISCPHHHPHYTSLLLIYEKQSIFHNDPYESKILAHWKESIQDCGFEFFKYQKLKVGNRLGLALAFKASNNPKVESSTIIDSKLALRKGRLWIKKDFSVSRSDGLIIDDIF
eukprot:gene10253-13790_t